MFQSFRLSRFSVLLAVFFYARLLHVRSWPKEPSHAVISLLLIFYDDDCHFNFLKALIIIFNIATRLNRPAYHLFTSFSHRKQHQERERGKKAFNDEAI
jgi:hypothetical protein